MKLLYKFFNKKWKIVVGLLFVAPITVSIIGVYWKLTQFLFTFVFPCRITEYSWGISKYCHTAGLFATISVFATIIILASYIYHAMEN